MKHRDNIYIYIYNYIKLDNFQVFVTIARQGGAF